MGTPGSEASLKVFEPVAGGLACVVVLIVVVNISALSAAGEAQLSQGEGSVVS